MKQGVEVLDLDKTAAIMLASAPDELSCFVNTGQRRCVLVWVYMLTAYAALCLAIPNIRYVFNALVSCGHTYSWYPPCDTRRNSIALLFVFMKLRALTPCTSHEIDKVDVSVSSCDSV